MASRSAASTAIPRGRRRRSAPRLRALPHLGPERTLRFVALPAGQDPDDVVRSGGREAIEALLAAPEPLVERLWRHEVEAAPLDTPEARAGLKQRLMEHTQAIGDPNVRQLYRDEWLRRFDALVRAQQAAARPLALPPPRVEEAGRPLRAPEPLPPGRRRARSARAGSTATTARALVLGHALYPDAIGDHVEALAPCRSPTGPRRASRPDGRSHHVRAKCLIGKASPPYWRAKRRPPPGARSPKAAISASALRGRSATRTSRGAIWASRSNVDGEGRDRTAFEDGDRPVQGRI